MSTAERLKLINERKQRLMNAAEMQRRRLVTQCYFVKRQLEWADEAFKLARTVTPVFSLLTSLIKPDTSRKCGRAGRIINEVLKTIKVYGNSKV